MGQNFSNILIKRKQVIDDREVMLVLSKINDQFKKDKEGLTYEQFLEEKWRRNTEGLIGFFKNHKIIIIVDEYNLIKNDFLKAISKNLKTDVIRVTNSDTVGISMIQIYENGDLIRMKSYGLEDNLAMLSGNELKSVKGIGKLTKYEEKGSNAISVFNSFLSGKVEISGIKEMMIFKEK